MNSMLWWHWLVLALPSIPNLWSIWHVRQRYFASEQEKSLWFLLAIFLPVLGGIIYIIFGIKRSHKEPLYQEEQSKNID